MKQIFFYIILISQSWLTIGTFCAHIFIPDHELIEILNEEEKSEKEKELEKEKEQIKTYENLSHEEVFESIISGHIADFAIFIGRTHNENFTPPPKVH